MGQLNFIGVPRYQPYASQPSHCTNDNDGLHMTYMQHLFLYTAVVTPSDPHSSERILILVAAIVSVSESLSLLLLLFVV